MVRDSDSGHQQLLPPANWCPMFASADHSSYANKVLRELVVTFGIEGDPAHGGTAGGHVPSWGLRCADS